MDRKDMKFYIIVQGGQSNAEGSGCGPVTEEFIPLEDVWYLNVEKTVQEVDGNLLITYADKPFALEIAKERTLNGNVYGDFALTFAQSYIKAGSLKEGRKLLIVRAAIGGTGFKKAHWGLGNLLYEKLKEMVEYALSLNEENRIVAFLWHQGEHDAFEKNDPAVFKTQLADQLQDFRARYGEKIPFVAGDFVSEWKNKNLEDCKPILSNIREVIAENMPAAFVETADLLSNNEKHQNGDDIHFCRESLHILGKRYFDAFQSLEK